MDVETPGTALEIVTQAMTTAGVGDSTSATAENVHGGWGQLRLAVHPDLDGYTDDELEFAFARVDDSDQAVLRVLIRRGRKTNAPTIARMLRVSREEARRRLLASVANLKKVAEGERDRQRFAAWSPQEAGTPIGWLQLNARAENALRGAGILTVETLLTRTDAELRSLHGLGSVSLIAIHDALQSRGLPLTRGIRPEWNGWTEVPADIQQQVRGRLAAACQHLEMAQQTVNAPDGLRSTAVALLTVQNIFRDIWGLLPTHTYASARRDLLPYHPPT